MGSAKPSAWSLTGLSPLSFRVSALEEWGSGRDSQTFLLKDSSLLLLLLVYHNFCVTEVCQEMIILPTTATPLVPSHLFLFSSLLSCFPSFAVSTVNQLLLAEGVHPRAHQAPVLAVWGFFDLLHQSVGSSEWWLLSGLPLPPLL